MSRVLAVFVSPVSIDWPERKCEKIFSHTKRKRRKTVPDLLPELFWANLQAWRVDFEQRLRDVIQAINHDTGGRFNHSYTTKSMGKWKKGESKKELEHQTSRMKNLLKL